MSCERSRKTTAPRNLSPPPPPAPSVCDSSESGLDETSESPSPRLSMPYEGPCLPSSCDTGNPNQWVRKRKGGEDEEVTVQSRSGGIRLDYYTDKAAMQSYQKHIAREVTNKESHDNIHTPSANGEESTHLASQEMEGISDSEADSVSTSAPDDSGVTHTFTFPLLSQKGDKLSHRDNELELQPAVSVKPKSRTKKLSGSKVVSRDARDSDSSVCSRKKGSSKKAKIKSKFAPGSLEYIEERLKGRMFSGWVEERRWVEGVGGYRDVIEVDEWEVEMNQQLKAIIASISGVQEGKKWINITRKLLL